MSEYTEVEQPFLAQQAAQGWTVIDQGPQLPQNPAPSLRARFARLARGWRWGAVVRVAGTQR